MKDIRELLFEVGKKNEVINPSLSKERALKRVSKGRKNLTKSVNF